MRRWHLRRLLAVAGAGVLIPGGLAVAGLAGTAGAATGPAAGTITTVIGGTGGPDPATSVSVSPCALKYADGALYFASNGAVDKVSQRTGTLTPVAGSGVLFGDDTNLPASEFSFASPCGVAKDPAGNVLVADGYAIEAVAARTGTFYGQKMRAGRVYTIARNFFGGDPSAANASMTGAVDVQLDPAGNLVIAVEGGQASHTNQEGDSQVVVIAERDGTFYGRKMTKGRAYPIAGTIVGYQPGNAVPGTKVDLGWSIGTLRFDSAGNIVLAASGSAENNGGPDTTGPVVAPQVRVIAAKSGTFYGRRMKAGYIYTIGGGGTSTANDRPATSELLQSAAAVSLDHWGNVLVADGKVRVIAVKTGTFYGQKMRAGDIYTVGGLTGASGIAVDNAGNVLAGSDFAYHVAMLAAKTGRYYGKSVRAGRVYLIAGNGQARSSGDGGPARAAELTPYAVAASRTGQLTAVDDGTAHSVRVVPGQTGTYFGRRMTAGHIYTVARAGLAQPLNVAFDTAGNLLIADTRRHQVMAVANKAGTYYGQKMTAGRLYPVAGDGAFGLSGDGGPARAVPLGGPQAVTAAPDGNVLLIDSGFTLATGVDIRVRLVAARTGRFFGQKMTAGRIYTVAGSGKPGDTGDGGPATAAGISPAGIAVDGSGNLIIGDGTHVRVVAARTGTFYGVKMTEGRIYTVAGGGTGTADGTPALKASLDASFVAVDPAGNLVVSAYGGKIWLVAERAGGYYGKRVRAGDVYTIASSASVYLLGDGGPATEALFQSAGLAVQPWNGSLLIADGATNRIRSVTR